MAEAHKINDGLYVVPLRDGKVQLRILIQEDEDKEEWRCKIFRGKMYINS